MTADRDDRLAEIRARWAKATPGPWEAWRGGVDGPAGADVVRPECDPCGWAGCSGARIEMSPGDADAIAAAPTDVAYLLDEIDRLTKALAAAAGALGRATTRYR